jgi:AcrR family transcriptional regulator
MASAAPLPVRDRILETAYTLFSRNGIRAVGVDRIVAESSVAKMSLYRHFPTKDDLVIAFLELRAQRWTHEWLQAEIERRAQTPRDRLITVFEVLDEWFQRSDFEGCSFLGILMENADTDSRIGSACVRHLETIRLLFADLAREAGAADPDKVAYQVQTLAMGSIVSAGRGDLAAARRVRPIVEFVLDSG